MFDVTVIKLVHREGELAPEFDYLLGYVLAEVASVFPGVELIRVDPDGDWGLSSDHLAGRVVLLLGQENVLIRRASLILMLAEIEAGFDLVRPYDLAATTIPQRRPIFTLRDFEKAEEEFLNEADGQGPSPQVLPLSMMRGELFAQHLATQPPRALRDDDELPSEDELQASRRGLFHRFIDYYGQSREDVFPFLEGAGKHILEIGCGRGTTGALLKERLGARVTGVEMNPEVARGAAQVLDEVIQGDVEKVEITGRFDVVLAFELFEHLVHGERFLERARNWLRPGGRIVLSVPNVGHYSIAKDLLEGRWDYLPIGLLCYTHYRFFTRFTLEQWLRRCGFEEFEIIAQKTDLPDYFSRLPAELAVDLESLATSGFYVIIRKPG